MTVINQAKRLTGLDPLAYMGVEATTPSQFITNQRDPTINDWQGWVIGSEWENTLTQDVWKLVSLENNQGTWVIITGGAGSVTDLQADDGNVATPLAGIINVVGPSGPSGVINTTVPSAHTLQINLSGVIADSFPTDSGTAVPLAGALNIKGVSGANISTTAAIPNTVGIALTGTTNHSVQVGNATGSLTSITNGTTGQVLTAQTGANPIWATASTQGFIQVNTQVFTTTGTYTPTNGMAYCIIEAVGGGGAGGSSLSASGNVLSAGGGGGSGGYSRLTASAATIGASQAITIGAGGTPGAAGNNPGGNGGDTTVGSLLTAGGGTGGNGDPAAISTYATGSGGEGGAGGISMGGEVNVNGGSGFTSLGMTIPGTASFLLSGQGSNSHYGSGGGGAAIAAGNSPGNAALGYGAGGSGSCNFSNDSSSAQGGAGSAGIVIITEFIS